MATLHQWTGPKSERMKDGSVEVRDGDEARLLTFDETIMQAYEIINTQEQTDLKQGRRGGGKRDDAR